ncbi:hypothetical protein C0995_009278 [Termitomyces sp. Mi166|nr:hypothetical protein C0995_009278 [Termitomyces sp. Mi166\
MASNNTSQSKNVSIENSSEVKLPMLLAGDLIPEVTYEFSHACHTFFHVKDVEPKDQDIVKLNIMLKDTNLHHDDKWLRNLLEAALDEDLDNHTTENKIKAILDLKKWASTIDNLDTKCCNKLKHIHIEADKLVCKRQALVSLHGGNAPVKKGLNKEYPKPGQPKIPADWVPKKKDGKVVTTSLGSTTLAATAPAQKAKTMAALAAWDKEDNLVVVILPHGSPLHSAVIEEADSDDSPDKN